MYTDALVFILYYKCIILSLTILIQGVRKHF